MSRVPVQKQKLPQKSISKLRTSATANVDHLRKLQYIIRVEYSIIHFHRTAFNSHDIAAAQSHHLTSPICLHGDHNPHHSRPHLPTTTTTAITTHHSRPWTWHQHRPQYSRHHHQQPLNSPPPANPTPPHHSPSPRRKKPKSARSTTPTCAPAARPRSSSSPPAPSTAPSL